MRYYSFPMPIPLDIVCPSCGGAAQFQFVKCRRIERAADIPFFKTCRNFEYRKVQGHGGQSRHIALYYGSLHGSNEPEQDGMPESYRAKDWSTRAPPGLPSQLGAVRCEACGCRAKHRLRWPQDAYFSVLYRGQALWAFDRESAAELCAFLESTERAPARFRWTLFLRHIPTVFKTHKARNTVSKLLRRRLLLAS